MHMMKQNLHIKLLKDASKHTCLHLLALFVVRCHFCFLSPSLHGPHSFATQNQGNMTVVQIEELKDNRQMTPGQVGDEMRANMLWAGTGATKTIPGTTGPEKVLSNMTRERTQAI
jgi:hypothetical protein